MNTTSVESVNAHREYSSRAALKFTNVRRSAPFMNIEFHSPFSKFMNTGRIYNSTTIIKFTHSGHSYFFHRCSLVHERLPFLYSQHYSQIQERQPKRMSNLMKRNLKHAVIFSRYKPQFTSFYYCSQIPERVQKFMNSVLIFTVKTECSVIAFYISSHKFY